MYNYQNIIRKVSDSMLFWHQKMGIICDILPHMWGSGASGAKKYKYLITYHIDLSINIVYHKKCYIASGKFAPILSNTSVKSYGTFQIVYLS